MYLNWILLLSLMNCLSASTCVKYEGANTDGTSWLQRIRQHFKDCLKLRNGSHKQTGTMIPSESTLSCLQNSSLRFLDGIMSEEIIPIFQGIRLIRVTNLGDYVSGEQLDKYVVDRNKTNEQQIDDFLYQVSSRITRVLQTHALQINFREINNYHIKDMTQDVTHETARHRRQRNNMIMAMVFGVTALGSVLVPMGFQFLAVVSGKALLLAKMALLLASINGLKRIATSGVHYGLYQVPEESYGYGYYDRGDPHHPRYL